MRLTLMVAALCCTALLCTGVRAQTLTECGKSDGYSYYFAGGLVPADKGGWKKDGIGDGRIILNYINGEIDLLMKNANRFNFLRKRCRWWESNPEKDEQHPITRRWTMI
jgi:hypothetical protein